MRDDDDFPQERRKKSGILIFFVVVTFCWLKDERNMKQFPFYILIPLRLLASLISRLVIFSLCLVFACIKNWSEKIAFLGAIANNSREFTSTNHQCNQTQSIRLESQSITFTFRHTTGEKKVRCQREKFSGCKSFPHVVVMPRGWRFRIEDNFFPLYIHYKVFCLKHAFVAERA